MEEFDDPDTNQEVGAPSVSDKDQAQDSVDKIKQPPSGDGEDSGVKGSWVHRANFGGAGRIPTFFPFSLLFVLFFFACLAIIKCNNVYIGH